MKRNTAATSRFGLFPGILPVRRKQTVKDALAEFPTGGDEYPAGAGLHQDRRHAGRHRVLHSIASAAGVRHVRLLPLSRGGPDSATAAILAGGLSRMAPIASARHVALAGAVAMLTAVALLTARILKLGFLADFLSQTVLVGFLTGVGFQVGIAVLGEMLGLEIQSRRTVGQFIEVVRSFSHIQLLTALISAIVVASIFTCHWFAPKVPAPLIAVVAVIAASKAWHFAERGVTVVGPVAGGLPSLGLPDVHWHDVLPLIGVSVSCFVVIVAQSAATVAIDSSKPPAFGIEMR